MKRKKSERSSGSVKGTDLISRQAVLDFTTTVDASEEAHKVLEAFLMEFVAHIERLPSAQPEQRWIPCSERLPEPDERVLVYTVANEYHVWDAMPHRADSYVWEDEEGLYHSLYEVDLWMPLPEPYKGDDQNG